MDLSGKDIKINGDIYRKNTCIRTKNELNKYTKAERDINKGCLLTGFI